MKVLTVNMTATVKLELKGPAEDIIGNYTIVSNIYNKEGKVVDTMVREFTVTEESATENERDKARELAYEEFEQLNGGIRQ